MTFQAAPWEMARKIMIHMWRISGLRVSWGTSATRMMTAR
jgi:hypothetical protein